MEHIKTIKHECPHRGFRRCPSKTRVPDGIGSVKFLHSISTARIDVEVGVDANIIGQLEVGHYTIADMVGVDGLEVRTGGGASAVDKLTVQAK